MEVSRRYRVNISTSVKGVTTSDQTVELSATGDFDITDVTAQKALETMILQESDAIQAQLVKRYPPQIDKKGEG